MYSLLYLIPKNHLSLVFGILARVRLPRILAGIVNRGFARAVGADLSESEFPPETYPSLALFFTRNLRPGVRPIQDGVVSPVDGKIVEQGKIQNNTLIQAKGRDYTLPMLFAQDEDYKLFENGAYMTIYLAPKDYHHIHSPIKGKIISSQHIPGKLWPVNNWSVNNIPDLFCVNERIITLLKSELGFVAVIMVGATNVGSISLSYDDIVTNTWERIKKAGAAASLKKTVNEALEVNSGDRLGTFNLGSTVILLFQDGLFLPKPELTGDIKLGQRI